PPTPAQASVPEAHGGLSELRRRIDELLASHRRAEAAPLYLEILDRDPSDRDAFNFLDSYYRRDNQHRARCDLMLATGRCDRLPAEARVLRLREAASLLENRLRDLDAAVHTWRMIAKLDPKSDEPRRNLKRLFERAKRWDDLVVSLEAEVSAARTTDARIQVLKRLVGLHRDQRGDDGAATDAMARLVALNPNDRSLTNQLIDSLIALGRFAEAVPLLERQVTAAPSKSQRLARLRALAHVLDDRLSDVDAAVATYAQIVELAPTDADALDRMIALDEAHGNHERLLTSLQRRQKAVPDAEAAKLCIRMGQIASEKLKDTDRAAHYMEQALELAPADDRILEAVGAFYERCERFEDLVEALRERLLLEASRDVQVALYRQIARTLDGRLEDPEGAAEAWNALLSLREDAEALRFLEVRARAGDDHVQLATILKRLAKLSSGAAARELGLQHATVLFEHLKQPREAATEVARLLDQSGPTFTEGMVLLERICQQTEEYGPLARVLERQLTRADGEQFIAFAQRLVDLYTTTLSDPRRAAHVLVAWSARCPEAPEPHRRLRALLDPADKPDDLLTSLDALAKLEDMAEARDEATIEAARLCAEVRHDMEGAWDRLLPLANAGHDGGLDALTELAPAHGHIEPLCELLTDLKQFERLSAVIAQAAAQAPDDAERVAWLRRLAIHRSETLHDPDAAEDAYLELLNVREDAEALGFRLGRARERDDPELLADCLLRLAALEPETTPKRDLLYELGQLLLTRLERPADAVQAFRTIVQEVAHDFQPALDGLVDAAESARDYPTLASALSMQLQRADGQAEQAAVAQRLADLFEGPLPDRNQAIASLREWRKADRAAVEPLRRLRVHLQRDDAQAAELLEVLDVLSALETARHAQLEATVAAATLARDALADPEGAWARVCELVGERDADVDAVLRSLATDEARFVELCERLQTAARHDELVDRLEERAHATADTHARADLHRRAARLLVDPLDEPQRAAEHYRQLLESAEDAEALRFMRTRAMAADDPDALSDCLLRLSKVEEDASERRDLLFEYAHLLRSRLARPQDAIRVLRELLAEDDSFDAALDELFRACEAVRDHAGMADSLERMLVRERSADARVSLARRLCGLYHQELQRPKQATNCLRRWIEAAPEDPEPLRRLLPLLTGDAVQTERLRVLDALTAYEQTDEAKHRAQLAAGVLCAEVLSDDDGAWQRLLPLMLERDQEAERALRDVAERGGRLADLCEVYERNGRYHELVGVLRKRAETARGPQRVELLRHCARTLRNHLEDELGAIEAFREMLADADDVEALRAVCDFEREQDDPAALAELLTRLQAQLDSTEAARAVAFERALILEDRLEQTDDAINLLREIVRDLDPEYEDAIEELIAVCEQEQHFEGLVEGLERRLAMRPNGAARAETARRLAEIYEDRLEDEAALHRVLTVWSEAGPREPAPLRKLRALYEARDEAEPLRSTLDRLSQVETTDAERREATRAAAAICGHMEDLQGALTRLSPLVLQHDRAAEALADELLTGPEVRVALAAVYTRRAQAESDHARASADWDAASERFEQGGEFSDALEATLRRLALDTQDDGLLDRVDALATKAQAWPRLGQVYKHLIRDSSPERRMRLSLRQAGLREREEGNPEAALAWALKACRVMPGHEGALREAERLASLVGSHADLLWLQEERARRADDAEGRFAYLLSAVRTADIGMEDREQANLLLGRALALTENLPDHADQLTALARELDERQGAAASSKDLRRELVRAHLALAKERQGEFGRDLVLRAAAITHSELGDSPGSYDILRQSSQDFPGEPLIIRALVNAAVEVNRLDGLDAHLGRLAKAQKDRELHVALLRTRGEVLAKHLERFDTAARVYGDLLDLAPDDRDANEQLITCLRRSGRFQELLRAYERKLATTEDPRTRVELLRAQANVWENDLRNRARAAQIWTKIRELQPGDGEADAALSRLRP
ncbi:MAG: hypothetical protein OXU20_37405, partial [Myxococcales bacterium]|nr:hypothetical protein [Myxococcales bacterium]